MSTDTRIEDPEDRDGNETPDPSDRRRRLWRNAVVGLAVALGVAGISVLSVFIYSLFDDDGPGDGWFAYEGAFRPVDYPEERGYQGDERGKGPGGGVYERDGGKDTARDRGAGHVDVSPRTGDSEGDGGTGPGDGTAATDGLADCVELKSLGGRTLLLCDRGERDGWEFDLPPEGRGKWLGPGVLGGGWSRGWGPWSPGLGPGPRGSGRWTPGGGPLDQRPFGDGFPYESFPERAPMGCPWLAPWGTVPDGGAGFGSEWSKPLDGYCVQGERDGYAFEECYGYSGDLPPEGWRKGLESSPPGSGFSWEDFADEYGGSSWMPDGKGWDDGDTWEDDGDTWEFGGSMPPELFDAWFGELLGSILGGLFEGFGDGSGVPEGPDGSIPPELPGEMFEGMLGSILGDLFDDFGPGGADGEALEGLLGSLLGPDGIVRELLDALLGEEFAPEFDGEADGTPSEGSDSAAGASA